MRCSGVSIQMMGAICAIRRDLSSLIFRSYGVESRLARYGTAFGSRRLSSGLNVRQHSPENENAVSIRKPGSIG